MADHCFHVGDQVRLRGRSDVCGVVIGPPRRINGVPFYPIQFINSRDNYPGDALERASDATSVDELLRANDWAGHEALSRIITYTKLREPLRDVIYAFKATRTRFAAYQFKPLVKLLDSRIQSLLIADEVGLGKTIEAGYILRELMARAPQTFRRVLVVCPAALRDKWRQELFEKFDVRFDILDAAGVRSLLRDAEQLGNSHEFRAICSIQTMRGQRTAALRSGDGYTSDMEVSRNRRPSLLDEIEAGLPLLDLVIIDEAHHLRNPGRRSHRLGQVLRDRSDAMLLLTATPIHVGSENLFSLLNLLDPQEFSEVEQFRVRAEANRFIINADRMLRRTYPADVDGCRQCLHELRHHSGHHINGVLLDEILAKLACCVPTEREHIIDIQGDLARLNVLSHIFTRTRKREVVEERPVRTAKVIRPKWTEVEKEFYDSLTELCRDLYTHNAGDNAARFAVVNLQQQMASSIPALLRRHGAGDSDTDLIPDGDEWDAVGTFKVTRTAGFHGLLSEYRARLDGDSKFDALLQQLNELERVEPGRKVIIFSFFRATLAYLEERLGALGIKCAVIHGGVPSCPGEPDRDVRGRRIRTFLRDADVRVLLSSEVGAEGLDFQTATHILVNYDLPWNPMRVEQRIGRLDRFGQPSDRIIIYNFSIPGTIEDRVLSRLYSRLRVFEDTIGDLEPIIGDEMKHIRDDLMRSGLTDDEREQLIEDRVRALLQKRQDQERFEQESMRFVGHDEYYMDQIRDVERKRRFLTPDELEEFVEVYLDSLRLRWRREGRSRVFALRWARELDQLLRNHLRRVDWGGVRLLSATDDDTVRFTCDPDQLDEDVELLSEHHPLIRAIAAEYEQQPALLHPVAAVRLHTDVVTPGDYLYFLFLLTQRDAVRGGKTIEAVFIASDGTLVDEKHCGELLHLMTTEGATPDEMPSISREMVDRLQDIAVNELDRRRRTRLDQLRRMNNILIDNRLASMRSTHEVRRSRLQARLEKGEATGSAKRYLRMIRGNLRNIEADFEHRVTSLEQSRYADIGFSCFAAGAMEIGA